MPRLLVALLLLPGSAGCASLAYPHSDDVGGDRAGAERDAGVDLPAPVCEPPPEISEGVEAGKEQACGGPCAIASCSGHECRVERVFQASAEVGALAVDDGFLYWTSARDRKLRRRPLAGGADVVVLETETSVRSLAIHGGRLFWTGEAEHADDNEVASAPLEGGTPTRLAQGGYPEGLAVTDDAVYWADFQAGIMTIEHAGGRPLGEARLLDGWVNARSVAVIDDTVFWSQLNLDNSLRYRALGSRSSSLLACYQQWPSSIVVDEHSIYWIGQEIHESMGRLMVMDRSGGAPRILAELGEVDSDTLVGDEAALYWVEADIQIMRIPK